MEEKEKEWPGHLRRYYDSAARNESEEILSSLLHIPSPLVNIILEYGYSWFIDSVINPDLLRKFNPGIDNMNDFKDFKMEKNNSGSVRYAFVELFNKIFPGDERGKTDIDYLTEKLEPYIFDYPMHSDDVTLIQISINNSSALCVDIETEDGPGFSFSNIVDELTTYISDLKKDAGEIFVSPLLQGELIIIEMKTGLVDPKYNNSTEIYFDFSIKKK